MIYLILSIVFSSSLFVIFKYFERYKINTLQAIVVNYLVAFVVGMLSASSFSRITTIPQQPWFYGALVLGLLFVSVFFVMAMTSQKWCFRSVNIRKNVCCGSHIIWYYIIR
ncbi:hypothetical protein [Tenacibaculum sp. SG-28]|uniref:hypothetical protein n=1 Tax=Tenacibaculum sp. SG-28 TaxID=754426 RepID=UPI001E4195AE|nr:hypothetical protein [Tenacibaculum sp. SG-28]